MEPIAIVGMGCNLPGKIRSPKSFWDLIMSKGIANDTRVPPTRFNIDSYLHENNDRPGSFNISGGYFLDGNLQEFDPAIFDISPIEAAWMDPQQRKLLEVVYEAIESSGCTLEKVGKEVTGCFAASFSHDFQQMSLKEPDFRHPYCATGVDNSLLGNRISHVFNLRGPSATINTACSASMYALHLACSAIRNRECDAAVVGGANLILTVDQQMNTTAINVLSPTNFCHAFDEAADGYGRGEGVGALYIKSLDLALKNGDPIRAVIRSTATNANGKVPGVGITHPSFQGQMDVIAAAYKLSGLDPALTSYVECHGTGTQAGDPVEVRAIATTMRPYPGAETPILIGSVKPNVGHSEASSSISTIIKAVLAIESGIIPPTAGLVVLNKKIKWNELQAKVVTEATVFPETLPIRRVGVSAFGYGGTNSHTILENVEALVPNYSNHKSMYHGGGITNGAHEDNKGRPHLLVFSAHDLETLKNNVNAHLDFNTHGRLLDLSFTLGCRRTKFPHRTFAVCRKDSYISSLQSSLQNSHESRGPSTIAFIFTGQGAQWPKMGARLLQLHPYFLQSIQDLDRHLAILPDPPCWTIEEALSAPSSTSRVDEAEFSQPLCTAIQIGLVDILRLWGIRPVATAGHSSGEIAAAYAAGSISANSAICAAYYRGKAVCSVNTSGAMLAVGLSATDILPYIESYDGKVVVACHNSPSSATVSGDWDKVQELNGRLTENNIFSRVLKTGGKAYHSYQMRNAAQAYEKCLAALVSSPANTPKLCEQQKCFMVSSVTGKSMQHRAPDPAYWAKNLESPVLFEQAIQCMMTTNPAINLVVEIGPHSALSGPFRQICIDKALENISYISSLKREEDDCEQLLKLAGNLWAREACIDMSAVVGIQSFAENGEIHEEQGVFLADLPPYQWNYKKHLWLEPRYSQEHRTQKHPRHDILGRRVLGLSNLEPVWRNILRHKDLPWLKHHSMGGEAVFPAAAYFAMAIEAITQLNSDSSCPQEISGYTLRDIALSVALVVPNDNEGVETLFSLRRTSNDSVLPEEGISKMWYSWTVSSNSYGSWKEHGNGTIGINKRSKGRAPIELPELHLHSSAKSWNQRLRDFAFDYGETFQNMFDVNCNGSHAATANMIVKQECGLMIGESRYVIHPACIDSCLQLLIVARFGGRLADVTAGTILTNFDEVTIWPPAPHQLGNPDAIGYSWASDIGNRAFIANSQLASHDGILLAEFVNIRALLYKAAILQESGIQREPYTEFLWKPDTHYLNASNISGACFPSTMDELISLYLHKNASFKILVLDKDISPTIVELLLSADVTLLAHSEDMSGRTGFKSIRIDLDSNIRGMDTICNTYDLILGSQSYLQHSKHFDNVYHLLGRSGTFIIQSNNASDELEDMLQLSGFKRELRIKVKSDDSSDIIVLSKVDKDYQLSLNGESFIYPTRNLLLVYRNKASHFFQVVEQSCIKHGWNVRTSPLTSIVEHQPDEHVIMLADLEGPLLATIQDEDFKAIQNLTDSAPSIIWITCGSLISECRPEYGMALGWSRVLRAEKSSLDLVTIDFDFGVSSDNMVVEVILDVLGRQCRGELAETEYCIDRNSVHIGRLAPARAINVTFVPGSKEPQLKLLQKGTALKGMLQSGKIYFQNDSRVGQSLPSGYVEIEVKAVGINEQDSLVVSGSDDSTAFSQELSGIITKVGHESSNLKVGDRVVAFSFDALSTHQRTKAKFVQRIAEAPFNIMATIPTAFCTAIYGLYDLASMETGDVVLILDGCGPAGLAAIQLCNKAGAKAVVISSSRSTTNMLIDSGLPNGQIICPGIEDVTVQVQRLTKGRGPDIIFASRSDDATLLVECSRTLAPFGRIVTFGKQRGSLLPSLFGLARGCSLFAFDLRDLYEEKPRVLSRLLQRSITMYQSQEISAIWPLNIRESSQIDEVFSSFQKNLGSGKTVIQYRSTSIFKILPTPPQLRFNPDASYLLIGCLGGLGRSLASWMVERGAKHLTFMSRSGTDNPSALALVESLKLRGVDAIVLHADVASKSQLKEALALVDSGYPIRGVVNAAMVLRDKIFQNMDIDSWREVQNPKVNGSLNLHEFFSETNNLDFFVMVSSVAGMLGSAGQSNYAAANSFLDFLARHRRKQGLPGVSLILPMVVGVGYIADHPEIETSLRRKGFYGIDETEMLASFEVAMMQQPGADHIIAGVEPSRLAKAISLTETKVTWPLEPRFSTILARIEEQMASNGVTKSDSILAIIENLTNKEEAINHISEYLVQNLSALLMINAEEIQSQVRSIASYGLDSMIGAEFRNWVFKEFKADIPFQQLLSANLTISNFAEILYKKVKKVID